MDGLIQQPSAAESRDSIWRPVLAGVVLVVVVVGLIAFFSRSKPRAAAAVHPYASNVKLSDVKMSVAQNFVGSSVTYVDGNVTNAGDKTVTHAVVRAVFKDDVGQIIADDSLPLRVLQTSGPYPDAIDLSTSPLGPGQVKPFRLTFESIPSMWNHQYPELQVTDVALK